MADDTNNHTIKLLQEMRGEMKETRIEMRERFDDVDTRIAGLTHVITLLAANMGGHEERIGALEDAMEDLSKT